MNKRTLIIAIEAVSELIDTLSENDFFNLIWVGTLYEASYFVCISSLHSFCC